AFRLPSSVVCPPMSILLSFVNNRRVRDVFWQIAVCATVAGLLAYFVRNASDNMAKAGIASGFDFLGRTSGIELPFLLTGYTPQSNILDLLWAGVVNTMTVALVAIIGATFLGFALGIARLSRNWLLANLAGAYVEVVRNIPVLFFVLFWYFAVIATLPGPREAIGIFAVAFLSNRGLTVPTPQASEAFAVAVLVSMVCLVAQIAIAAWARPRRDRTGRAFPTWASGAVLIAGVPIVAFVAAIVATPWDIPVLRGFNYRGGFVLIPEFVALVAALATYAAA